MNNPFTVTIGLMGLMLVGFLASLVYPVNLFGIYPRTATGLIGIPLAPFLHGNGSHLLSNMTALATFGPLFVALSGRRAAATIATLIFFTGSLTWLFARPAIHLGASGLIFALYGYLISIGFYRRKPPLILLSVILVMAYGYLLLGVLPGLPGISWESHLFGFIAGLAVARND